MTSHFFTLNALLTLAFAIMIYFTSMSWNSTTVTKPYQSDVWDVVAGGSYPSGVLDVADGAVNTAASSSCT